MSALYSSSPLSAQGGMQDGDPALKNAAKRWTMRIKSLDAATNQFAIILQGKSR